MTRALRRLFVTALGYATLSGVAAGADTLVVSQVNQIVVAKFEKLEAAIKIR
jgi:hypothetical protein